jgi:hypothetical protein
MKTVVIILLGLWLTACSQPTQTPEQRRADSLQAIVNNAKVSIGRYMLQNLDDPRSYEPVAYGEVVNFGMYQNALKHQYRAKNRFGALVLSETTFVIDPTGEVLYIKPEARH